MQCLHYHACPQWVYGLDKEIGDLAGHALLHLQTPGKQVDYTGDL